jgi:hypothetical protein
MENTIVDHSIFQCSCFIQYFPVLMKNTIVDHSIFLCSCFIQYFPVLMKNTILLIIVFSIVHVSFSIFQCSWFHSIFSSAHGKYYWSYYFPVLMVSFNIFQCSWKILLLIIVFSSARGFIQYFPVLMENTIVDHSIFHCSCFHSVFSSAHGKYYWSYYFPVLVVSFSIFQC